MNSLSTLEHSNIFSGGLINPIARRKKYFRHSSNFQNEKVVTVGELLKKLPENHKSAFLMGVNSERMPVFINSDNHLMRSTLIMCGSGCGKTHHLQVITESALRIFPSNELRVNILSANPGEWVDLIRRQTKNGVNNITDVSWCQKDAKLLINRLSNLIEKRQKYLLERPEIFLIMDDLNYLLGMDFDSQIDLKWLIQYGPALGVWLFASISTNQKDTIKFWSEGFLTTIYGKNHASRRNVSVEPYSKSSFLDPGEFFFQVGGHRFNYHLPLLGG